jgi:hypothetical protein
MPHPSSSPILQSIEAKLERIANNLTTQTRRSAGYERLAETLAMGLERILNPTSAAIDTAPSATAPTPVTPDFTTNPIIQALTSTVQGLGQTLETLPQQYPLLAKVLIP